MIGLCNYHIEYSSRPNKIAPSVPENNLGKLTESLIAQPRIVGFFLNFAYGCIMGSRKWRNS